MSDPPIEPVEVMLGTHKGADPELFGPLPGRRCGDVVAYEMQAPTNYEPWPDRSPIERKFALLDVGVSLGVPCWRRLTRPDGEVFAVPLAQQDVWYVDLVTVDLDAHGRYVLRDLFVDVVIGPGRMPRMLDLEELADACSAGWITTTQLFDGLRRWQQFLDRYVHASRYPQAEPTDFPPAAIGPLERIPGLFGPPVTWPA